MQTFTAEATVVDTSGPSVAIVPDTPLARGEWVRGMQALDYEASDNVGVRSAFANLARIGRGEDTRGCDYSQRMPCPNGRGQVQIETERAQEGSQPLYVTAQDAAGNNADSATATAHIDNTPPGVTSVGVEGGEAWRNRNDFDLAWQNASRTGSGTDHRRALPRLPRWY